MKSQAASNRSENTPRRVVFLTYPHFDLLDFAGPWEVFHVANLVRQPGPPAYSLEVVSGLGGPSVDAHGGPTLLAKSTAEKCKGPIDTLVVPAAAPFMGETVDEEILRPIRRLSKRSRRVASVCAGAFLLAHAGLLDGKRATTHWRECDRLARLFPEIEVEPDVIFVQDGPVFTSAGVTAGLDLALALVEADLGRKMSLEVARNLVMFVRRPGGQTQFSATLESQVIERDVLRDLMAWVADHLEADNSVEALAVRANMSPRNFSRVFRRETGRTPARFVERLRVDAARRLLEESNKSLEEIAASCGFGGVSTMRRSFAKLLQVAPSSYRERFLAQ